ncbi:hypothetical protein [Streptomyces sp. NPDC059092]|uniref:hypothetical protein n=1 Tax=Streptomyces sp. NPDC059092 TaxID=3346725 RepID=UPI0036C8903E
MTEARALDDVVLDWNVRCVVETPYGRIAVYVTHLDSVRGRSEGFVVDERDRNGDALGRSLVPLVSGMRSTRNVAGKGFGFTWPSSFPVTRLDQIMVKGVRPASSWTLPRALSDHLQIAARLQLQEP